jgi:hypothetical protein
VIDMTAEELLQNYPSELSDLELDLDRDGLDLLLKNVGDRVEAFFSDFSNTSSKEKVLLQILGSDGRVLISERKEFNYLILSHPGKGRISWEEERTDKKFRPVDQSNIQGFFLSSGYACLCIYLHPSHHAGSSFRYLGREISKRRNHVSAFAQIPKLGDYVASYYDVNLSRVSRFLVQGLVWLDPDSYQIVRMQTRLLEAEEQTSLQAETTDIYYGEVRFDGVPQPFWLPREVIITGKLPGKVFRNQHLYSDYHLFAVGSDYKISGPQIKN